MDKDEIIKELSERNAKLEEELQTTKEHLKKYTAPASRKLYYESNKEYILEKMKANPTPPEKRKEYNRESYLRKKEKLKKKMEEKTNNETVYE
jgi:hypothetical protein